MNLNRWAADIPRARGWMHDARLLADPYRYLSVQMAVRETDALQVRLMGEPTLCVAGSEAVAFFYDARQIQRRGAAPEPLRATLFGKAACRGWTTARTAIARRCSSGCCRPAPWRRWSRARAANGCRPCSAGSIAMRSTCIARCRTCWRWPCATGPGCR
jgi:hypothetical protein